MIPMLGKTQYQGGMQADLKYLLTIHNIAFQGKCGFDRVQDLLGVDSRYYTPEFMELNGCANFLKGGLVFADRINTVSPSYAEEIKMPYYAEGLEGILNARHAQLSGIINGIDKVVFNPGKDPMLPAHYDKGHRKGKAVCKAALQEKMGLERRPDVPVFAMVTRMTEQKGFDLVACVLDDLMCREDMQFMLLGTGDERFENFMRGAEYRYKGRLCSYIGYSDPLSHLVYAGSDFLVMPSRFEPCGLSQMMAMRYGTIPIVHETGGLKDSVRSYSEFDGIGDGFSFPEYTSQSLMMSIMSALRVYFCDEETFFLLRRRCMEKDFSWKRSAERYQRMYAEIFDGETGNAVLFEDAFAELKEAYVALDAENRERFHSIFTADYQRVVQIHVTGRAEGVLYVRFSNEEQEPFRMEPYSYDGADAYVTANFDHLLAMARGELSFDKLFLSGQIRVDGNLSKGTEIRNLLCKRE